MRSSMRDAMALMILVVGILGVTIGEVGLILRGDWPNALTLAGIGVIGLSLRLGTYDPAERAPIPTRDDAQP